MPYLSPAANGQRNSIVQAMMNVQSPPPRPQVQAMPTASMPQMPVQMPGASPTSGAMPPAPMPGTMPQMPTVPMQQPMQQPMLQSAPQPQQPMPTGPQGY